MGIFVVKARLSGLSLTHSQGIALKLSLRNRVRKTFVYKHCSKRKTKESIFRQQKVIWLAY